ncbi:uncharacterized protein LOC123699203 [Colias croceus]|uniref:uncharacterized protein LOC123699203 n=1 Tax=Colias crocea TaxID=72248 RepID=UPI001E27C368|nr:uncharacterized protein LOC123699203 [Colias croceus]CAG4948121.1 unnamed protein product [Colias eurytheme]
MPLNGCSSGLLVTALVTLLLLPAQYYVPDFGSKELIIEPVPITRQLVSPEFYNWFSLDFPPLDIFFTVLLILLAFVTHLCDWIQRKLMERRILKLNVYLKDCVERLRVWDARQEQVEATLRTVQNATSEYNLLLYLMLRHRRLSPAKPHCYYDKDIDDINYITNQTIEV